MVITAAASSPIASTNTTHSAQIVLNRFIRYTKIVIVSSLRRPSGNKGHHKCEDSDSNSYPMLHDVLPPDQNDLQNCKCCCTVADRIRGCACKKYFAPGAPYRGLVCQPPIWNGPLN